MSTAESLLSVMAAYNRGDANPLISTFAQNIEYNIVDLGRSYRGVEEVTALARAGAGLTHFHVRDVISYGPFLAFTYEHDNRMPEIRYRGPGLAVQRYNDQGKLTSHWAYRGEQAGLTVEPV